jgi:hypothetical protein
MARKIQDIVNDSNYGDYDPDELAFFAEQAPGYDQQISSLLSFLQGPPGAAFGPHAALGMAGNLDDLFAGFRKLRLDDTNNIGSQYISPDISSEFLSRYKDIMFPGGVDLSIPWGTEAIQHPGRTVSEWPRTLLDMLFPGAFVGQQN